MCQDCECCHVCLYSPELAHGGSSSLYWYVSPETKKMNEEVFCEHCGEKEDRGEIGGLCKTHYLLTATKYPAMWCGDENGYMVKHYVVREPKEPAKPLALIHWFAELG